MAMVVGVILVTESDLLPFNGKATLVTDGDTVAVSSQITHDSIGKRQRGLAVKHPIGVHRLVWLVIDATGAASTLELTNLGALP